MEKKWLILVVILGIAGLGVLLLLSQQTAGPNGAPAPSAASSGLPPTLALLTTDAPQTGAPLAPSFAPNSKSGQASPQVSGSAFGGPAVTSSAPAFVSALITSPPNTAKGNVMQPSNGQEGFTPLAGIPPSQPVRGNTPTAAGSNFLAAPANTGTLQPTPRPTFQLRFPTIAR